MIERKRKNSCGQAFRRFLAICHRFVNNTGHRTHTIHKPRPVRWVHTQAGVFQLKTLFYGCRMQVSGTLLLR